MYRLLALFLACVLCAAAAPAPVIPASDKILSSVLLLGIDGELVQIPATVIDEGMLKGVPYVSYRVGPDCELNIYGDPEKPGCIEVGLYNGLLGSAPAKQRCINFLNTVMRDMPLGMLRTTGGKVLKSGVVAEVTLPDAPDAYGGWWVTVYNQTQLRAMNGTTSSFTVVPVESSEAQSSWTPEAWKHARPGGKVWVPSYTRKDGTNVSGHSRSKAGR